MKTHLNDISKSRTTRDIPFAARGRLLLGNGGSIFEVRWVASEKKAVDKLILYYQQIMAHLTHVTTSDRFNGPTKDKAKGLLRTLNDKKIT